MVRRLLRSNLPLGVAEVAGGFVSGGCEGSLWHADGGHQKGAMGSTVGA